MGEEDERAGGRRDRAGGGEEDGSVPHPASPAEERGRRVGLPVGAPASDLSDPESYHIVPGNNRRMQKRRRVRRRLFGTKAKEAFLESFSCTANCEASARAVGFSVGAVFAHRRKDPEFRENYWIALEQATGKLAALRVQREIERAEGRLGDGLAAAMDGPPDARQIADLVKLMAALRDLTRNLGAAGVGAGAGAKRGGHAPATADLDAVCAALAKRLKAFPPSPEGRPSVVSDPADKSASHEATADTSASPSADEGPSPRPWTATEAASGGSSQAVHPQVGEGDGMGEGEGRERLHG